jgi:hypothetical protein
MADVQTSNAFVLVHRGGNLTYVILEDRAAFDSIDLPVTDHGPKPKGHVLTKNIDGPQYVVFQFWIDKPQT